MSGPASSEPVADEHALTAYVARDGVELGAFWRDEIEPRARAGELRADDYYWHEGMENWLLLEDVLGPEPWQPPPAPLKKRLIVAGAICGAFMLAALIAIFVITAGHEPAPLRRTRVPAAAMDPVKATEMRNKAAAELHARIERLPDRAGPPLYTFYYDVSANMRPSAAPRTQWEAMVHGSENTIDPATEQTIKRTEFTLITEYRDGEWAFNHYKSSTRHLDTSDQSEDEHNEQTAVPPPLVTMLGLKLERPDAERR